MADAPGCKGTSRACGPSKAAQTHLLSLPDDVLLRCLGHLSQYERLQYVSLVCKRLRALCVAPHLLRSICVELRGNTSMPHNRLVPTMRSLHAFLAAHGRHIQRLQLELDLKLYPVSWKEAKEAQALLHSALVACGSTGGSSSSSSMQELDISIHKPRPDLTPTAWLGGLTSLRRLKLVGDGPKHISPGIGRLLSLEEAFLLGGAVDWSEVERLPPSLTSLRLVNDSSRQLPAQVSQLTALATLRIATSAYSTASTEVITTLTSLRSLRLDSNSWLPACLPALTWLEQLAVYATGQQVEELRAVLPNVFLSLSNLTCLSLRCNRHHCVPPAVAALPRLQRLCITGYPCRGANFSLPRGTWLTTVRWLGLHWELVGPAVASGVLNSASSLEYLCALLWNRRSLPEEGHPLWAFAATHPPLRCLAFESLGPANSSSPAIAALRQRRSSLRLRFLQAYSKDFNSEMLEHEGDISTIPESQGPTCLSLRAPAA